MQIYTVHIPAAPKEGGDALVDAVLIKEGFSWPGFFFSVIWALWHRLWWVALGMLAVNILAGLILSLAGFADVLQGVSTLAIAVLIGFTANDLRRWTLARRGFDEVAVVAGDDADMAFARYLADQPAKPSVRTTFGPTFTGVASS